LELLLMFMLTCSDLKKIELLWLIV